MKSHCSDNKRISGLDIITARAKVTKGWHLDYHPNLYVYITTVDSRRFDLRWPRLPHKRSRLNRQHNEVTLKAITKQNKTKLINIGYLHHNYRVSGSYNGRILLMRSKTDGCVAVEGH